MAQLCNFYTDVSWHDDQIPVSQAHQDPYFSKASPVEESQYVFLDHNNLEERLNGLIKPFFHVFETGFGTGLNAILTLKAWLSRANVDSGWLYFTSVEKFPLSSINFKKSHQSWPELGEFTDAFRLKIAHLPAGWHRLEWPEWRFSLTLIIDDAHHALSQCAQPVDAWYLDGFAPSKNPDMWTEALYQQMARLSHEETTLATFTAAGHVRRGLQAVGFDMTKTKGFGSKRDMLIGQHRPESPSMPVRTPASFSNAVVVGSGLAGASTAFYLARMGVQVTVLESENKIAAGASGNPRGVLHIRPGKTMAPLNQLVLSGYSHTLSLLKTLDPEQTIWQNCGILQPIRQDAQRIRFETAIRNRLFPEDFAQIIGAERASEIAGVPVKQDCLYFPEGGWVSPEALCSRLLQHPNISLRLNQQLTELQHSDEHQWKLKVNEAPDINTPALFLCSGISWNFDKPDSLAQVSENIIATRGQLTQLPINEQNTSLKTVFCDQGYLLPEHEDYLLCGATFQKHDADPSLRDEDHQENLDKVASLLPEGATDIPHTQLEGRTSFRAQVRDLHPLVGQIDQGLWINTAHGSRGLVTAPVSARFTVAQALGQPSPLSMDTQHAIRPIRFKSKQKDD